MYDLKIIDLTKQYDRLLAQFTKCKDKFDRLHRQKTEMKILLGDTLDATSEKTSTAPKQPQTLEESECRKKILQLENEIHTKTVQYTEAEYVRKKYNSIRASLWDDAERFEKSLLELENSLREQQANISRIKEVYDEAVQMKDTMTIVLMRCEHVAHTSAKARERQASDFRGQVEERRLELERLERKLFATCKTVLHQGSTESLLEEQHTDHSEQENGIQPGNEGSNLEEQLKNLMTMSGATSPQEVLQRFVAQKEATSRLNYLRSVTEVEKKQLETRRETLLAELEATKFTDVKESEVYASHFSDRNTRAEIHLFYIFSNQEHLEQLKNGTSDKKKKEQDILQSVEHSRSVLNSIKTTIIDLVLKLREIDDIFAFSTSESEKSPMKLNLEEISNSALLRLLEEELKRGLALLGDELEVNEDSGRETDEKEDSRKDTGIENMPDLTLKVAFAYYQPSYYEISSFPSIARRAARAMHS